MLNIFYDFKTKGKYILHELTYTLRFCARQPISWEMHIFIDWTV